VPPTTKHHHLAAAPAAGLEPQKKPENGTPLPWSGSQPLLADSIAELDALLRVEPVNLTRVSNGFRAHPDLEFVIMRLGESLALPLDVPPCTIEEAAIGLGTDRLRALVHALSLVKQSEPPIAKPLARPNPLPGESVPAIDRLTPPAPADASSARFSEAGNLETLYLAGFLHWLGLDSRAALAAGHPAPFNTSSFHTLRVCGLTDVFMRDFITLIPFLDPSLLTPIQNAASEVSYGAPEDKAE
jgi:hypothetical protein